jgi:hypothetical protein
MVIDVCVKSVLGRFWALCWYPSVVECESSGGKNFKEPWKKLIPIWPVPNPGIA